MIYVHIPFCRSFCTYCDFYSEVAAKCRKAEDAAGQDAMFACFGEALVSELRARAEEISDDTNTLYIGGGTPSVLPLSVFERLLSALREIGHGGPYDEFTVEVNPEDIVEKGEAYVEGLLKLGVNRVSMGVQSFDDKILRFMNRRHDSATARKAYGILEKSGVRNISIDIIFGLPQLSDEQWADTLKKALDISGKGILPEHISSYQLSVEEGSMLARLVERGVWHEASEELCARQYSMLCETLAVYGYNHYEISNFAQPGFEAVHNSAYWKHVPYVGLGPGAHSFIPVRTRSAESAADSEAGFIRQWNKPDLKAYIKAPLSTQEYEELSAEQLVLEHIMLGLRTSAGLPASYLEAHCDPRALSRALSAGHLVPAEPHSLQAPVCKYPNSAHEPCFRIPESCFFISDTIISELV